MAEHVFIVGVQRCGSTYLHTLLDAHPDICMNRPTQPEPKFFVRGCGYDHGLDYSEQSCFKHRQGESIIGEKSVSYMELDYVPSRMHRLFPCSRILIILRDPVDRAISNFYFTRSNGLESRSLEEVFVQRMAAPAEIPGALSVSPYRYLERGRYLEYIRNYQRWFDAGRAKVLLLEALSNNLPKVQALYEFLGVAADFRPPGLDLLVNEGVWKKGMDKASGEVLGILRAYYESHNEELGAFLDMDLDCWG